MNEDDVYRLLGKVLDLARSGLVERGYGEAGFLDPLYERVKNKENPASYMLRRLHAGTGIEELIKEYG